MFIIAKGLLVALDKCVLHIIDLQSLIAGQKSICVLFDTCCTFVTSSQCASSRIIKGPLTVRFMEP